MTRRQKETRAYRITAEPAVLDRLERLLAVMQYSGDVGHTGTFGMWLDGDGADRLKVEGFATGKYRKGCEKITGVGYHVEMATDHGFSGTFLDRGKQSKWSYDDNGKRLEDFDG
ncbi:MAG: hypothetical protein F4Y04_06695 [Chloroflexi bacterium]|nr:hypothetical protein [Chloroflexota bacterium]